MNSKKKAHAWWLVLVAAIAATTAHADAVDDFIVYKMSTQHIPGLSLAVLKNGKPVKVKGYGYANLELGVRADPETVYKIGSISKQFIAGGIMLLNADGKVGLNDSITKYLDGAPNTWRPITVRHALTHTGGLVREAPGFDPLKVQSDADVIRTAYASPLNFKPGENQQYSNLGYFVLAEIIARASGKPWPQFLQERLFTPLGMSATQTTTIEKLVPHRANAYNYDWNKTAYRNSEIYFALRPSGAFLSNVLDLAKWDAALYTDTPFTEKQRALMWTLVKLNNGSERPYGFGWAVERVGQHRRVSHGGALTSFRSDISRFVDDQLTVIVLANAALSLPELITFRVAAFYIPDLMPKRTPVKLDGSVLDGYVGKYWPTASGNGRLLTRRGNGLALAAVAGEELPEVGVLMPESSTRFFNEDDTRLTYVFESDADGRMNLVLENLDGRKIQKWTRGKRW